MNLKQSVHFDSSNHLRLQLELHKVFVQRGSIRKELLELESSDRDLTIKISRKHLMVERLRLIHGGSAQGDKVRGNKPRFNTR